MSTQYSNCLTRLRKVNYGDYVLTSDHNTKVDCLRAARDWVAALVQEWKLDPQYVYELDMYLARLRRVAHGDIIDPNDHNSIVDTLYKLREVLEKIEANAYGSGLVAGWQDCGCYPAAAALIGSAALDPVDLSGTMTGVPGTEIQVVV